MGVVGGVRLLAAIDESLTSVGWWFRTLLVSSSSDALQLSTTGMLLFLLLLLLTLSGKPSVATPASCNETGGGGKCNVSYLLDLNTTFYLYDRYTEWKMLLLS